MGVSPPVLVMRMPPNTTGHPAPDPKASAACYAMRVTRTHSVRWPGGN